MNYYNEIKNKLIDNEIYKKVKDYSKNRNELQTYYDIGKLLIEAPGREERAKYGNQLIKEYCKKLIVELDKKYNERTLRRIRQFYLIFKDEKWSQVATKLSWSHYCELLSLKNENAISYYINECIKNNIGRDELREKIKDKEYERLPENTKNKLINQDKTIGIIIVAKDNKYIIEYCSDKRIFSTTYLLK